jgi:hypothetical protein
MKRGLKAALISAPLVLLLHFASLAQSFGFSVLSKNANGTISNGSLSLLLSSNPGCDETQSLIPDGSRLVSNNFIITTDSRGLGTFSGPAKIVRSDGLVLFQGSMRGTVGVKRRCDPGISNSVCRAPGRLEGIFESIPSAVTSPVAMLDFTAEPCLQCAPPTPIYRGVLDGVTNGLPTTEGQVGIASDEPSFIGRVSVTTNKSEYNETETILSKVTNGLEQTIATWDHQSYCTILTLQKLEPTGSWMDVAPCLLETPTRLVRIGPLTEVSVKIPPGNSSGIYRLRLTWQFVDDNGQPVGNPTITYSPQFTITSSH